ncbi:MAG TPA: diguanylate cyclase [Planctomycetota bacterium]|nr:diguanylate cyclase [Planctomycetota bacterium]
MPESTSPDLNHPDKSALRNQRRSRLNTLWADQRSTPVPFFSRLGVKHGIILTSLVLMAMVIITSYQLRETIYEIERSAISRGRAVATAIAPLALSFLEADPDKLRKHLQRIVETRTVDYIQIVDADGTVILSNNPVSAQRPAHTLHPNWTHELPDTRALDRFAVAQNWPGQSQGIDVFVALLEDPLRAAPEQIRKARHLRVGISLEHIVKKDTPRIIRNMLIFSLFVAAVMFIGLIVLLSYILRPLRELHLGLRALARGDLTYEVPAYSRDEVGQVIQAFNATTARLRFAFEQIEALATRDPLTNLPNRRIFDERLASEAARSRRYGHPFGLIVMDLDHFKNVNDVHGHQAGDEVLRYVSKVIEISIRETDVPARIGGEEFAVILPETNYDDVHAVAEKLRSAVSEQKVFLKDNVKEGIAITISAGAACSVGHLVTPEAMVTAADAALYRSKGEGRNRVTMAPRVAGQSNMMKKVDAASGSTGESARFTQ